MDRTTAIISQFVKADISAIAGFVNEFGLTATGIEYVAPARTKNDNNEKIRHGYSETHL